MVHKSANLVHARAAQAASAVCTQLVPCVAWFAHSGASGQGICTVSVHFAGRSRCKNNFMVDKSVGLPKALYSHAQRRDKAGLPGLGPGRSRVVIKLARKLL